MYEMVFMLETGSLLRGAGKYFVVEMMRESGCWT